jgi:hypothetical protein
MLRNAIIAFLERVAKPQPLILLVAIAHQEECKDDF